MTDANQQAAPQPSPIPAAVAQGGLQAAGQPAPLPPGVKIVNIGDVFANFESRIKALEAAASAEVSKGKAFVQKYWPLGAGLLVAASRFIHL